MKWPDWEISEQHVPRLARYVDPEAAGVPLGAYLRGQWEHSEAALARIAELYRLISSKDIAYAKDPWNPARFDDSGSSHRQRIRTPAEVLQGVGSCLDLSLLFAGMAIAANIRPLLAITLDATVPHALVVLDIGQPLASMSQSAREEGPAHWQHDDRGIWRPRSAFQSDESPLSEHVRWWDLSRSRWLAVDITYAARTREERPREFAEACRQSLPWAEESAVTWSLLDIEAAMENQEQYVPPTERSRFPIHSYLPELAEFREYPTRGPLIEELDHLVESGARGRLVLHGPGGRGKSLLAQRIAWTADNGCGWFLNATDVPTLRASLAAAEQAEIGQWPEEGGRAERPNATEVAQLAYAALARFNNTDVPWVVILDNCDGSPSAEGLEQLVPRPHAPGQFVIITTRNAEWSSAPDVREFRHVPPLAIEDLRELRLPQELAALAEDPLVAEPLAVLATQGAAISNDASSDPRKLLWALVKQVLNAESAAVCLVKLISWLPPGPIDIVRAPVGTDPRVTGEAADELVRLRFLTPVSDTRGEGDNQRRVVQLHRMLAEVIREEILEQGNSTLLDVLVTVLTSPWGRAAFIESPDGTALSRLEGGVIERAAEAEPDVEVRGRVWHGLGHIRERRGPVAQSRAAFEKALKYLDPVTRPYEVAEASIGLARIAYQARGFDRDSLLAAQGLVGPARQHLNDVEGIDARLLDEQGNALYWLIERKIAGKEKDSGRRLSRLSQVEDELWKSYEQRLRTVRGPDAVVTREPPLFEEGLGPERAYYNLAGVHLELAKARYDSAKTWWAAAHRERREWLLAEVGADLDSASMVYEKVADLRARRYMNRPHPHHAACIHGHAIVAYHRAALLNKPEYLVDATRWLATALRERWQVAFFSPDTRDELIFANDDVRKSVDLLGKVAAAGSVAAEGTVGDQVSNALRPVSEALAELMNWNSYHSATTG
jgi:hypothetical protein